MIWGKTYKEKREIKAEKDKNWFVWYPVRLINGRWCWFERVSREYWTSWESSGYDYAREKL